MPTYNFKCNSCCRDFVAVLPVSKRDDASCPECSSKNVSRDYTGMNFSIARINVGGKGVDSIKRQMDMRDELRENHLVHGVSPLNGKSFEEIYKDIKKGGSKVKEQMQKTREDGERVTQEKLRKRREDMASQLPKLNKMAVENSKKGNK